MLPHGGAAEALKDQVMIQVLPGVLDGHVTEKIMVHIQDIVRPDPHLSHNLDHASNPFISVPGA